MRCLRVSSKLITARSNAQYRFHSVARVLLLARQSSPAPRPVPPRRPARLVGCAQQPDRYRIRENRRDSAQLRGIGAVFPLPQRAGSLVQRPPPPGLFPLVLSDRTRSGTCYRASDRESDYPGTTPGHACRPPELAPLALVRGVPLQHPVSRLSP